MCIVSNTIKSYDTYEKEINISNIKDYAKLMQIVIWTH